MSVKSVDPTAEVLAYIKDMPAFSKAICEKLRAIILASDPGIIEEWKWGPHYQYNGMVCGYGAFQKHVKLTFFNGAAMADSQRLFNHCVDNQFSRSIKYTDVKEIDENQVTDYVRESIRVNKGGFKREIKNKTVEVPDDFNALLTKNKKALAFFEALSYGYKKEYVDWIISAKRPETRKERIERTILMCAEHKRLNDKYKA
jgi:hypothetical protein